MVLYSLTGLYILTFVVFSHTQVKNLATAKDGLKMTVRQGEDLPELYIYIHSFSAMALLAVSVYNKESIKYMVSKEKRDQSYFWSQRSSVVTAHRYMGYLGLFAVIGE